MFAVAALPIKSKTTREEVAKAIENFVDGTGGRGIGTTSYPSESQMKNLKQSESNACVPNRNIQAAQTGGATM